MSIKIRLTEREVLTIRVDADAWARAYKDALASNSVIEVHDADGRTLAINPHQILYWEEVPDEEEQDQAPTPEAQPA